MTSNRKRTMLDFFAKSKKTKTTDNDGGESQEPSSSSSSTDCPADKSASVQNPNESETSAASDQPSTSGQKKTEKRSFQKNWLRDFKWLKFQEDNNSMSCTLCIKHKKSNALSGDCRNFKTSTLTRHADSKDHKEAVAAESMAGSFEKTVKKVLDEKEAAVVSALKVVFWMTKEDISIIKYESLLNLFEELDCPSIVSLKTGKKVTYSSDKAATEMLESLAYVARQKVNNLI